MVWRILILGLVISAVAAFAVHRAQENALQRQFEHRVNLATQAIEQQLAMLEMALHGIALPMAAPGDQIEAAKLFAVRPANIYPGIQTLGFAAAIASSPPPEAPLQATPNASASNATLLTQAIQKSALPATVDPAGTHTADLGWLSQPQLQSVREHAYNSGAYALSKRIDFARQGLATGAGFVMLHPAFREHLVPREANARRAALLGFSFAMVDSEEFFAALRQSFQDIALQVFASAEADHASLLYATNGHEHEHGLARLALPLSQPPAFGMQKTSRLQLGGQTWTVIGTPTLAFVNAYRSILPYLVGLTGLALSLLMFWGAQLRQRTAANSPAPAAEAAARAQQARLQRVETVAHFGSYEIVLDRDCGHQTHTWSPGMFKLLGAHIGAHPLSCDEYIDRLVQPAGQARLRAAWAKVLAEGGTAQCEYSIQRPDGTTACIYEWMKACTPTPGNTTIYGFRHDVTVQRHAEAERLNAAMRFQALIEQLPGVAYLASLQKNRGTLYVNRKIELLLGFSAEDWSADRALRLRQLHPQDRKKVLRTIADARASRKAYSLEYRVYHRDGSLRWLHDEGHIITNAQNEALFLQGVMLDITERKLTQQELQRAHQRMQHMIDGLDSLREQAHKRLAKEMHDDFGQLLAAMKMDIATLQSHLPVSDTTLAQIIAGINDLVDTMINSVRRIIADQPPQDLDDHGLFQALRLLAAGFSKRHGIDCRVHTPEPEPLLGEAVAVPVYRMVQEALNNVAKHAHATNVDIRLECSGDSAMLCVRDNGRGMVDDAMQKAGSFGLIGMRERIMALGGDMQLDSAPGAGTTLRITIPLQKAAASVCA